MTWVLIVLSPVLTVEGQLQAGPRLGGVGQDVLGLHHAAGGQVAQSATRGNVSSYLTVSSSYGVKAVLCRSGPSLASLSILSETIALYVLKLSMISGLRWVLCPIWVVRVLLPTPDNIYQ